jgi:hypothetical protein
MRLGSHGWLIMLGFLEPREDKNPGLYSFWAQNFPLLVVFCGNRRYCIADNDEGLSIPPSTLATQLNSRPTLFTKFLIHRLGSDNIAAYLSCYHSGCPRLASVWPRLSSKSTRCQLVTKFLMDRQLTDGVVMCVCHRHEHS